MFLTVRLLILTIPMSKETQEYSVKKTMWTKILATDWKYHVTHPHKAVKRLVANVNNVGQDTCGLNLSFYRAAFFNLNVQTQFDLYVAGMAPKMTRREVDRLRASVRQVRRTFKTVPVMYAAHVSPSGHHAPPRDLVAEAQAAKDRAAGKKTRKQQRPSHPDALPVFPTPNNITKVRIQAKPAPQRRQQPQQQPQNCTPQRQTRLTPNTAVTAPPTANRTSQYANMSASSHAQTQRQSEYAIVGSNPTYASSSRAQVQTQRQPRQTPTSAAAAAAATRYTRSQFEQPPQQQYLPRVSQQHEQREQYLRQAPAQRQVHNEGWPLPATTRQSVVVVPVSGAGQISAPMNRVSGPALSTGRAAGGGSAVVRTAATAAAAVAAGGSGGAGSKRNGRRVAGQSAFG
jgi:hypothetical protein